MRGQPRVEGGELIERYTEMLFKTEGELDAKIAELRQRAEFILRGTRAFRVGEEIIRVQVLKLGDRFYLIHTPREPLAPRIFTVAIQFFRLCEIPIPSPKGEMCGRRTVTVILRDGELFDVCNYHGAGATPPFPVFRQIADVPGALCAKFCPQYFKYDELP